MTRRQLPPGIRKVEVANRRTGKADTRYEVVVGVPGADGQRRQLRRRFTTEAAARDFLAETRTSAVSGTYVHSSKQTLDELCEAWLTSKHNLKPSTLAGHRSKLEPLRKELGHLPVQKLTREHLDDLVARLRAGEVAGCRKWSARSVNYLLSITTSMLNEQVRAGRLVRNPAAMVERVAGERHEMKTLTEAEVSRILEHESRDRHLWSLALLGLRRGEVAGLRWVNVDLDGATLTVVENRVTYGKATTSGSPKSARSRRTLPLPTDTVRLLRAARQQQRLDRIAAGSQYGGGEYVASDELGNPLTPNTLTYRWGRMLETLGIAHVRLHDARHSAATLMHLRGVPIAVIAAWLGHASAAFTMATYAHSQDEALKAAADSFGRVVTFRDTETGSE